MNLSRKRSNSWNFGVVYNSNPSGNLLTIPNANSIERSASVECVNVNGVSSPQPHLQDRYPSWGLCMDNDSQYNYQVPTPNAEVSSPNPLFQRARERYSPSPFNSKSLPSNFRNMTLRDAGSQMSEASSVSDFGSQEYIASNVYEDMGIDQDIKLFHTPGLGLFEYIQTIAL